MSRGTGGEGLTFRSGLTKMQAVGRSDPVRLDVGALARDLPGEWVQVLGEAHADAQRGREVADRREGAVVVALAEADAGAVAGEAEAGREHEVDAGGGGRRAHGDLSGPRARLEQAKRRGR